MRVRVSYVVVVSDELRRAINAYYGRPGKATRAELRAFYEENGATLDGEAEVCGGEAPLRSTIGQEEK